MPIPFSDIEDFDTLGSAAYLKLEPSSDYSCCLGALLVISARGAPLEFGYNRVRVPQPFLWREPDLRNHVQRRLITSLLSVCSQQPRLLLCLEDEVSTWLFSHEIQVELPIVRVASPVPPARRVDTTTGEVVQEQEDSPAHIAWHPTPPEDGSPERLLFEYLAAHGLLLEPFERAVVGLREVYGPVACPSAR